MARRYRIAFCLLSLIVNLPLLHSACAGSDPDKDPRWTALVAESEQLATAKKSSVAIAKCDQIIAAFKAYYGKERRKIYCGNTSAEILGNLLRAAVKRENSIVLSPTWANAYFIKGYAL